jgi:hypothetical protein
VPGTRRILLEGSRYHVYYVPLANEVRVGRVARAAWGRPATSQGVDMSRLTRAFDCSPGAKGGANFAARALTAEGALVPTF